MPCPACDAERLIMSSLETLAFGAALGAAYRETRTDLHGLTEIMCAKHRSAYVLAMLTVTTKTQAAE